MYSAKKPDTDGFYWCNFGDDLSWMCHWNPESAEDDEEPVLLTFDLGTIKIRKMPAKEVTAWIGPLDEPFGEMCGSCAYFTEDDHRHAGVERKALVMIHVDGFGTDKKFGTATTVGVADLEKAVEISAKFFRGETG